jgi:hypothetical protein
MGPSLSLASCYRQVAEISTSQTSLLVGVHNKESAVVSVTAIPHGPFWYVSLAKLQVAKDQNIVAEATMSTIKMRHKR